MKETLNYLFGGNILEKEDAKEILTQIATGQFSNEEIASFLTVFQMRPITPQELLGFREAMLGLAVPVDFSGLDAIDVCGTGGDGKNTFNISTLSSFIIAGAGIKVVKHGNYGLSSPCGSSNIFEHFGYQFSTDSAKLSKELDKYGICYFHAPIFHTAMKHVGPVRKALKVKTFFNMLGPMTNPSRPRYQFVGVFNENVLDLYSQVYKLTDIEHGIVFSKDGYDEISLTGDFQFNTKNSEKIFSPGMLGFATSRPEDLFGGDTIDEAAKIFLDILEGKGTKIQTNVVIINSAFAIQVCRPQNSIEDCIAMAKESLISGKAYEIFKKLFNK